MDLILHGDKENEKLTGTLGGGVDIKVKWDSLAQMAADHSSFFCHLTIPFPVFALQV